MKRPSNMIIAFISALAGIFLIFAVGRIALRLLSPPEIEIEEDLPQSSREILLVMARSHLYSHL